MLQKKLGQRIADLRKNRHLTQVQLAKKIGCSEDFISLVERGVNAPSVAGLQKFARVLKVEVADLFTFERKQRPQAAPAEALVALLWNVISSSISSAALRWSSATSAI